MIKALLIDMDGLLIDSEKYAYQIYVDFLKQYDIDFSLDFYAKNMSGYKAIDNVKTICKEYHIEKEINEVLDFIVKKEAEYFDAGIPCKKGAIELLTYLKQNNYKIILATSSSVDRAMKAINFNNLKDYFDDMAFGPEVNRGKPYPDIFLKAQEKSKCTIDECLVLEDAETGIQAANNAGIKVICVPDVKKPREEYINKCECICNDLLEVIDYLKKSGNN